MSRWDLEDALEVAMVLLVAWNQHQVKYLSAGEYYAASDNIHSLVYTHRVSDKSQALMVISEEML